VRENGLGAIDADPFVGPGSPRPASLYPDPSALVVAVSTLLGLLCWLYHRLGEPPEE
jgi:hypothetical protein